MPEKQVFISYSHTDKKWRTALDTRLKPHLRGGSIVSWSDQQIAPGSQWFNEIQSALANSHVAVLLVSPDFLASDFIHEHELGPLLKEAERGGVTILWVPIYASAYKQTALEKYQAVLEPNKPLGSLSKAKREEAWVTICEEIQTAVNKPRRLRGTRGPNLSEHSLDEAHLHGANLRRALLSGEDLRGANLSQTDLSGAVEQRQREEKERLQAEQREREQREQAATEMRELQEKEQLDARRREHEEQERLEHEPQSQVPSPVVPVATVTPSPPVVTTLSAEEKARSSLERATKDLPWVNSLGMKFVPVAGTQVLFSVWDTRVQDFEAFVADTKYDATRGMWSLGKDGWKQRGATWKEPGFSQGANHPVVGVSWNDAKEFCKWLTKRERSVGDLPEDREYRLPKDEEWSAAVGLKNEAGSTPEEKSGKIELYPWDIPQKPDKSWPPPKGAGNYAGEEAKIGEEPSGWSVIKGYKDGYPRTSAVASFAANANGLYDMGGNVWQWCENRYDATEQYRVLRGASWDHDFPGDLLASNRDCDVPDYRGGAIGFRCIVGACGG
jgi:formylglycine-generating enzyme required for sulfatase activity